MSNLRFRPVTDRDAGDLPLGLTGVGHMIFLVNLDVDDLEKAIRFYQEVFGLQVGRSFGVGVEMLGSSVPIYLLVRDSGTAVSNTTSQCRSYERHLDTCPS
jgi:extradiol dioxygenase family protein